MKYYTGVGSRKTPQHILDFMNRLAHKFASLGYILRSGGAKGADTAFANGAEGLVKIYRPEHATPEAMAIAEKVHPAWHLCDGYARALHARNAFQVLGDDLKTPSSMLVCWTPDGCRSHATRTRYTGGTGTAISIASNHGIRVANLAYEYDFLAATKWFG